MIGGVIGGLAGGGANLIGNAAQGLGSFQKELARSLAHGSLGGVTSLAQGGKFKHGFFSGMFASMAGSGMEASKWSVFQSDVGSVVTAAVVGGTASGLGGGKFANGAVTGAYTMLFNHLPHKKGSFKGNAYYVVEEGGMSHAGVYFPEEDIFYELYDPNPDELYQRILHGESKEQTRMFIGDKDKGLRAYETPAFLEGRGNLRFIEMSVTSTNAAIAYFSIFVGTGSFPYNLIANNCKSFALQGLIMGGSIKAAINYMISPVPAVVIGKTELYYIPKKIQ